MKKIYYLHVHTYDYCNNWEYDILYTLNKNQLEGIKSRLEKKYKSPEYGFYVRELDVNENSLNNEQIQRELSYIGVEL